MKKHLILATLVLALSATAVACTDTPTEKPTDTAAPATEGGTVEAAATDAPVEASQGLEFTANGDGTCYVSGMGSFADKSLVIPETSPEGDKVTGVGPYVFTGADLTSVILPDSVTSIGETAFFETGLTSVTIPAGVTSIGKNAFSTPVLTSLTVDQHNTTYHSAGNCIIETATKTLVLGCMNSVIPTDGSVTSIGTAAFLGCTGLTSITLPDSLESLGDAAFSGCSSLTSITLPDSITTMGDYAFNECEALTSITLSSGLTSIGDRTFFECGSLTSIEIPDGVTTIGDRAFVWCLDLTSVKIPASVTSIHNGSFSGCNDLTDVQYGGTAEQWEAVSIGEENDNLLRAELHCLGDATTAP